MAGRKRSVSGAIKANSYNAVTYISLLRGINVGGGNVIKKDKLQLAFESVDCMNVRTYIQSGNIVFEASSQIARDSLILSIKTSLKQFLTKDIDILLLTYSELLSIVTCSPFPRRSIGEESTSSNGVIAPTAGAGKAKAGTIKVKTEYVTLLCTGAHTLCHTGTVDSHNAAAAGASAAGLLAAQVAKMKVEGEEDYCIVRNDVCYVPVAYTFTPRGVTEGKYCAKMFHDKHSKVNTTTRNFDTILTLLDMAKPRE